LWPFWTTFGRFLWLIFGHIWYWPP
jgi:hypothetical protein